MQHIKVIIFSILLFLSTSLFAQSKSCKGHEDDIKNEQTKTAERMHMIVNSIKVEYIGNCQYRCISDIYDPGTKYSSPQNIKSTIIYKWEGKTYRYLRDEKYTENN